MNKIKYIHIHIFIFKRMTLRCHLNMWSYLDLSWVPSMKWLSWLISRGGALGGSGGDHRGGHRGQDPGGVCGHRGGGRVSGGGRLKKFERVLYTFIQYFIIFSIIFYILFSSSLYWEKSSFGALWRDFSLCRSKLGGGGAPTALRAGRGLRLRGLAAVRRLRGSGPGLLHRQEAQEVTHMEKWSKELNEI